MYRVSCSGDAPCPQSYNTSNNQTRSHIFTGFTASSYYTFSVVAINSIGSGEAGVVMVGEIISTTIAPSVVSMTTNTTATITSMGDSMTISSVDTTTTSTMDVMITNTTILSGTSMTTINNINASANISATNTVIPTSMVDDMTTVTSIEGVTVTATTSNANTTTTLSSKYIMHVYVVLALLPFSN